MIPGGGVPLATARSPSQGATRGPPGPGAALAAVSAAAGALAAEPPVLSRGADTILIASGRICSSSR
jgi:hypothetical protein